MPVNIHRANLIWYLPRTLEKLGIDSPPKTWTEFLDQAAAIQKKGDWLDAYWGRAKQLDFGTDYRVAPSPGSDEVYDFLSDSFTLPVAAKHRAAAIKWLEVCGSVEGQDAFNPKKGSVPARIDADKSKYKGYLATALEDWQDPKTKIVGSLTHGVVANNARNAEIDTALGLFVLDGDSRSFGDAVARAYEATT